MDVETRPLVPRDAGFLARTAFLVCKDCGGHGHDDETGVACDGCMGTGGVTCQLCPSRSPDRLAVVIREGRWNEPACRDCAEDWVGRIDEYDTPHELECPAQHRRAA